MAIPAIPSYPIPPTPDTARDWFTLDPCRVALLIHDMQTYFLAAYDRQADPIKSVLGNTQALVDAAHSLGIPVFYSAQPPRQHTLRRGLLSKVWGQGIQTHDEAAITPELAPGEKDVVVTKWRYSAFERTDLLHCLGLAGRDQLIITGVYGHMGCMMTAADAFMKDIQPFLIADAVADFSAREHAEALSWVAKRAGVVLDTAQVLDVFAKEQARVL